ncbi:MAG TPA: DUF4176 domain-containing protein [Sarcina sp.]|nr:hypothetical protein SAMN04487833_10588 [Sarcina sp. DSM 11001]HAL60348.1 DUF4176 domain-containing protein [Sarcina sp.]
MSCLEQGGLLTADNDRKGWIMDKKHNEIFEGLLPIGSVVTTKTGTKRVMIIGRGIDREDGQGSTYDYGAVLFPEGFSDGDHIYLFNHEDVGSICRVGYIDEVEIELEDKLSNYLRSGVTPVPEKR